LGNNTVTITWTITGTAINGVLNMQVDTVNVGWLGLGWHKFNSTAGPLVNMLNADIHIAVFDGTTPAVADRFSDNTASQGKAAPVLDTSIGGTNDILTFSSGQTATSSTFSFSKKLNTGDITADWPITPAGLFHIIYASGSNQNLMYHGSGITHRGNWLVNFFTGASQTCAC